MEDEDEAYEGWETPSYQWSWKAAGVHAGFFVKNVLDSASELVKGWSLQLAASCNYDIERRAFHEQAALEIESITESTEE